jgi:hypothetical protein
MIVSIVLGCFIGLMTPLTINYILNLKSEINQLKREKRRYNNDLYYKDERIKYLEDKLTKTLNNNLMVGATFYYPDGYDFKPELVNKRAKIIEISDGVIKTRLIDEFGEFMDDKVWTGTPSNAKNYIYEPNRNLNFKFN